MILEQLLRALEAATATAGPSSSPPHGKKEQADALAAVAESIFPLPSSAEINACKDRIIEQLARKVRESCGLGGGRIVCVKTVLLGL